jgi:RHS repeat-associated protein
VLDISGNQREVIDAKNRVVMRYDYDLPKNRLHQASMEAGERWTLNDVAGKPIRLWDSRGHNFKTEYDELRRPLRAWVRGVDAAQSDPRTLNRDILFQKTVYGEALGEARNHRTRVYQGCDQAGVVLNLGYDFKGNLLQTARQLARDYKQVPDWSQNPALDEEVFSSSATFDALNRHLAMTTPDGSVTRPTYNEANLLERLDVNLRGAAQATPFVTNLDYNAKGQRVLIEYGILDAQGISQVNTLYRYDPETFRLVNLRTMRKSDNVLLQDLNYFYDPTGNITHIQDDADTQNIVYFRNKRVEPSNNYVYDAIYRLIRASGREHLGQTGGSPNAPTPSSYNDWPRVNLPHPHDGNAMGTYLENFGYDPVGNIQQIQHLGSDPANPGWTRAYAYNEPSLLEPGNPSNRLSRTNVGSTPENYSHDVHGNMTTMPHLFSMAWDFKDQLQMTQRQRVNDDDADGAQHQGERTYYVYDASGQRVRKVTESPGGAKAKERIYAAGFEVFREGSISRERQTLHVMDDKQRVALVETLTQGNDGSPPQIIRFQFANHLGSACLELDLQALIVSYEEYAPYGSSTYHAVRSQTEAAKRYRYTGRERDEESDLYHHKARYYAPWLGRWTQADPAGIAGGPNGYSYANENPVRLVDPDGKQPIKPDQHDAEKPPPPSPEEKGEEPPEQKNPQPTVYNAGPTQTAFVPGDVTKYGPYDPLTLKPPLGSVAFEGNFFILPDSTGAVTSYAQIAARWRTSEHTEQGFLAQAGGQTGSSTFLGSLGYQLHQGTPLDTRENAPFQKGQGNWFTLSLASTPREKVPSQSPDTRSSANVTASYVHAWSYAWHGGNTMVDLNAGANAAVRSSVYGRDVYGFLNPFLGVNISHQFDKLPVFGENTSVNFEATTGPALGATLVNPGAGDPRFPISLRTNLGLGVQKQIGKKGDYTIGGELLGNFETPSTVHGQVPWGLGAAFTLSAY